MSQINIDLYKMIANYYADIQSNLLDIEDISIESTYKIIDVTTENYIPGNGIGDISPTAAVDVTMNLLKIFNSSSRSLSSISNDITSVLFAVRTINNYVINNYNDYPNENALNADEKLAEFVNIVYSEEQIPTGWKILSENAGYDTSLWEESEITLVSITSLSPPFII